MDDVLKQRLIGAAVLIALAVIFVPMLFDRSQDPMLDKTLDSGMPQSPLADQEVRRIPLNPNPSRQGPSTDQGSAAERPVVPMPSTEQAPEPIRERLALSASEEVSDDEASWPEQGTDQDSTEDNEARSDTADRSGANDQTTSTVSSAQMEPSRLEEQNTADTPSPSSSPATADWSEGWRVQVASFGVQATAEDIANALRALGQGVRVDRIVRGESVLYRIQTGPYADRETAEQAQALISESVAGVAPVVRAPAQAIDEASNVDAGYAVQVGSFTSQANAERLQKRLIDQRFDTFLVTDLVGSRTIWRVRVGTVATRERAEQLLEDLKDQAGVEGLVVSHP